MSSTVPLIDRREERKRFQEILAETTPRLVTVQDKSGNGKSRLLEEFRNVCGWTTPRSLVPVGIETIRAPLDLVRLVADGFELGDGPFEGFRELDKKRAGTTFESLVPGNGQAHVGGGVSGEGVVAGSIGVVAQAGSQVTINVPERPDEDPQAARECVAAFLDDLHALARDQPVVIMFDEYEKCKEPSVQTWIVDDFLRNHVLTADRRSKLIVVIAGQTVPDLRERLKERHDELVYVIPQLGKWTRDDVSEFLTKMLGREPEPEEVDAVEMWFAKKGWTVDMVVKSVKVWPE
jgi:hypothetical protein